ncbi:hypothetical protein C8R41DRAFT_871409 [Lentinula lateritia]|uniref:CBM21 domain-containing protein n=1 Tax=Lentinula lateritia TaxID=40482 RepID=A0ABQ8V2A0_9AGAR|nr:hypothetical protein C8R41DRAFT_871409 [Lentinula lateritia]
MPYSQPASSPRSSSPSRSHHSRPYQNQNNNPSTHSLGRPGHRRSYSSQAHYGSASNSQPSYSSVTDTPPPSGRNPARFTNEQSISGNGNGNNGIRGAWGGLGSLPRRHSSASTPTLSSTNTSKFRIGDRRGSSSSSEDDEGNDDHSNRNLPPLKLKVQVMPSFSGGIPFPKSSVDSPVRMGPMAIPNPASVAMTRSSVPTRTSSSPELVIPDAAPSTTASAAINRALSPAVILLSNGKPLRSSLKGSRISSLLSSPMGSAANSPSVSPVNSVRNSPVHSTASSAVTSPVTSPTIPGTAVPSFASFTNFVGHGPTPNVLLVPPSFSGHVRAQSAPSPPMTPGQGIEAVLESTWTGPISPMTEPPPSPGLSELMSPDALLSPRSVHFPSLPSDLERVRVFRKEARPSSLLVTRKERDQITNNLNHGLEARSNGGEGAEGSGGDVKSGGEETDTETETDREYGYGYNAGYWGTGRGLWDVPAPSFKSNGFSSSVKAALTEAESASAPGAYPFPRLPRLGRTRSAGGVAGNDNEDDGGESSSSSSGSGGRIHHIRNTGTEPRFARREEEGEKGTAKKETKIELDVPSPIPRPESVRDALAGSTNVFLEDVHLDSSSSSSSSSAASQGTIATDSVLSLEGTFLVRNVAFEKHVSVRFTTDDWSTVNEVRGKWVGSCGRSRIISLAASAAVSNSGAAGRAVPVPRTLGDLIALANYPLEEENSSEWDRFAFRINLPPAVGPGRIVEFVGRFAVGNAGGEWWDNCGGKNWRIGFKEVGVINVPIPAPVLLKILPSSPAPAPLSAPNTEIETISELSPISSDVPISNLDVAADSTPISLAIDTTSVPTIETRSQDHAELKELLFIAPHITPPLSPANETAVEDLANSAPDESEQQNSGSQETIKGVKERAPKPTGLGSLSGLGGLFWPWRNTASSDSQTSSFSKASSSVSGSVESPVSFPPTLLGIVSEASSLRQSSPGTNRSVENRNLPASATVKVLSVLPPAAPPVRLSTNVVPISGSSSFAPPIRQSERERVSSEASASGISRTDSIDSMMDVPLLERSSSSSSVSTDGEYAEMTDDLFSGGATLSQLSMGASPEFKLDLTPVPNGVRAAWLSNDDTIGEDQTGFFDNTGHGSGVGISSPSVGVDKPLDADPLYRAFVQQWCFAGTGSGSHAVSESSHHTPSRNRNRLQVM